jgi:hypothetical protein
MNRMMNVAFATPLLTATAGAADVDNLVEASDRLWSEGNLEQTEATSLEPGTALPHAQLACLLSSQIRNAEARKE